MVGNILFESTLGNPGTNQAGSFALAKSPACKLGKLAKGAYKVSFSGPEVNSKALQSPKPIVSLRFSLCSLQVSHLRSVRQLLMRWRGEEEDPARPQGRLIKINHD